MSNKVSKILVEYTGLVIGCLLYSIGVNMFYEPFALAPGGLSGIAIIISNVIGLSVSTIMLFINIPILLISARIIGKEDAIKTFVGMMALTLMLRITEPLSAIQVTEDALLSAISGGIISGIGLGIVFRVGASMGGTDLIATTLNRMFRSISISKFMMIIDGIIVLSSGLVTRNLEIALYSGIALYIMLKVIDAVLAGFEYSTAFMIITNEPEKLRKAIVNDLKKGVTILDAKGGYTNQPKNVLIIAVNKKQEEVSLKKLIESEDPNAFIIISNVHEVLGGGFKKISA